MMEPHNDLRDSIETAGKETAFDRDPDPWLANRAEDSVFDSLEHVTATLGKLVPRGWQHELIEDAQQDVAAKIVRNPNKFYNALQGMDVEEAEGYLFRAILNRCLTINRQVGRRARRDDDVGKSRRKHLLRVEMRGLAKPTREEMMAALMVHAERAGVSSADISVYRMRIEHGLDYDEIAKIQDVSKTAVYSSFHRAKRALLPFAKQLFPQHLNLNKKE